jgi:cytochrome c biogenesis protein CcmG, thiol:disulfide interchange protein DsbE
MIGHDRQGLTAMDLGVYGAPETFLIDKKGIIRYRHVGLLTPAVWEQTILPLKKQLEAQA